MGRGIIIANNLCRNSADSNIIRHIMDNDSTGTYHCTVSNMNTSYNFCTGTDVNIITNRSATAFTAVSTDVNTDMNATIISDCTSFGNYYSAVMNERKPGRNHITWNGKPQFYR